MATGILLMQVCNCTCGESDCPETICVYDCGTAVSGVQVQFLDAEGGPACDDECEGYTGSDGCYTTDIDATDPVNYIATATYEGTEATQLFSGCGDTLNFYNTCITYDGCTGPEAGAKITVNGIEKETDSTGKVCFFLPTGTYSISVTAPTGRVTCSSGTISAGTCEVYSSCTLTEGYVCCNCPDPICKTLTLVDSVLGNVTLTANAGNPCTFSGFTDWWVGTLSLTWGGACGCPAQQVTICYEYTCPESGSAPTLAISVCLGNSTGCETNECPGSCPGVGSYPMPAPTLTSSECGPLETVFGANYGCNCGAVGLCFCNNDGSPLPTPWALWGTSYPTAVTWTILDECSP